MARLRFLVTGLDDPSARFRVGAYQARFRDAGHDADVAVLPGSARERARLFRTLGGFDAVVLLRRLLVPWETWRLRRSAVRLVFEYDDALVLRDTARGARPAAARAWKFGALARTADRVVAGNAYLAGLVRPFRKEPAAVVPTVVDPAAYPMRAPHRDRQARGAVFGWIGTRSNLPYLEPVIAELARLAASGPVTLRVMADAPPATGLRSEVRLEYVPWSAHGEAAFLAGLDIGLMPLADDAWCRGKCGLKALQYMATGVPVVAADVGVTRELIGAGGVVLPRGHAWGPTLRRLAADAGERNRLARAGRARVETRFSPDVWFDRLQALYFGRGTEDDR